MNAQLTLEESMMWEAMFGYYAEEGWSDEEADERAWEDVQQRFPRLKRYAGVSN